MNRSITEATHLVLLLIAIANALGKGDTTNGNPFTALLEQPAQSLQPARESGVSKASPPYPILTRVVNAFPPSGENDSRLAVILQDDKIEGVRYGSVVEKKVMMYGVEDFVIHFTNSNGAVVMDYGTLEYGYIEGEVSSNEEVLVIVRRSKTDPHKPQHYIKLFPTKLEDDTSRVYLYNAVWNTNSELGGLKFYEEDRRTGKLMALATEMSMGEGHDIDLPPGKSITIKASHADLTSDSVSDIAQTTASIPTLHTVPGRRHYVVVFGDQGAATGAVSMGPVDTAANALSSSAVANPTLTLTGPTIIMLPILSVAHFL